VRRSTKPVTVERHNQSVTSVAQRVQGAWRTAEPGQKSRLWDTWPALADAIAALDLELNQPVIGQGDLPGWR
jgi:hypothetical protein